MTLLSLLAVGAALWFCGCHKEPQDPKLRHGEAKALYEHATKEYHLPSASTNSTEQAHMLIQAAGEYEQVLKKYPEQEDVCAEALLALGNVRAAQTNIEAALHCWSDVVARYPHQDWEVLTALKSSADRLWEANRKAEAKPFYEKIVAQFDQTNAPQTVRIVVRGSRLKLEGKE